MGEGVSLALAPSNQVFSNLKGILKHNFDVNTRSPWHFGLLGSFFASLGSKKWQNSQNRPIWMKMVSNDSCDSQVYNKTVKCIKSVPLV